MKITRLAIDHATSVWVLLMIIVLMVRPYGLYGTAEVRRV